ncbi:hypothetical protein LEN26_012454 [Aphanomyces euteiches]|nr:hypothetical protein AeMF1_011853 [Aphanomyces euteiches]KAH9117776.1 hypothetical protein LEN26_012454 [Aphanomyces euteiches]KAH9188792.1 hypothetical protein AeNC1_009231 [Aphanomyces euteiches]
MKGRSVLAWLLLVIHVSLTSALPSYQIYTSPTFQSSTSVGAFPELPPVLVQGETISDLAVTVYSRDVMALSIVPVVDASHTFSFSPAASLDFTLSQTQVVSITIGGGQTNASGTYWIQYMAMSSNSTIFRSLVVVVPRPVNYFPSDPLWSGSPLASDKFDSLPFGAIPTTMWSTIEQGFASDACGKVGSTGNALYFTHLGLRQAITKTFDLTGLDASLSFAYIYGYLQRETYDASGNNTLSCEQVQPGAEVQVEVNVNSSTTWQPLLVLPIPPASTQRTMLNATLALPALPQANLRWIQHNQTSGRVGSVRGTRYQWQYRNLFDQWAIDNVNLTVRVQPPSISGQVTRGVDSLVVLLNAAATNSSIVAIMGDGTHPFPSCANAGPPPGNVSLTVRTIGYIHAVACVNGIQQSYGYRSPRLVIQSLPPVFNVTASNDSTAVVLRVTMPRPNMTMRFTFGDRSTAPPSCSYGSLMNVSNGSVANMTITSNGILRAVACGFGVVGSDVVTLPAFVVKPNPPNFTLVNAPNVTTTGQFSVTIASNGSVAYSTTAQIPTCGSDNTGLSSTTLTILPKQQIVAVSCCVNTFCNDSSPAWFGPVNASAAVPRISTSCSTTSMLSADVTLVPGTIDGSVKYKIGLDGTLDCQNASISTYNGTFTVAATQTPIVNTSIVIRAITCIDGLLQSSELISRVSVDGCCAGAMTFSPTAPCSSMLLFRDSSCNLTQWSTWTTQYGGSNVNGGVHADNVECIYDDSINATVINLNAHGDKYSGSTPLGVAIASNLSVVARNATSMLDSWALPGIRYFPCNPNAATCAARRVGASVSTNASWNAGVASFDMKACNAFGTISEAWLVGDLATIASAVVSQPSTFVDLWRGALKQDRTWPYSQYVAEGSVVPDDRYHRYVVQWNRTEGRANVYRDGMLVQKFRNLSSSADLAPLTFHVWFPNAWAGVPMFDTCSTRVANVQVMQLGVASNRWCDWEQQSLPCEVDAHCSKWIETSCFMPVASAICIEGLCAFSVDPLFALPGTRSQIAWTN